MEGLCAMPTSLETPSPFPGVEFDPDKKVGVLCSVNDIHLLSNF